MNDNCIISVFPISQKERSIKNKLFSIEPSPNLPPNPQPQPTIPKPTEMQMDNFINEMSNQVIQDQSNLQKQILANQTYLMNKQMQLQEKDRSNFDTLIQKILNLNTLPERNSRGQAEININTLKEIINPLVKQICEIKQEVEQSKTDKQEVIKNLQVLKEKLYSSETDIDSLVNKKYKEASNSKNSKQRQLNDDEGNTRNDNEKNKSTTVQHFKDQMNEILHDVVNIEEEIQKRYRRILENSEKAKIMLVDSKPPIKFSNDIPESDFNYEKIIEETEDTVSSANELYKQFMESKVSFPREIDHKPFYDFGLNEKERNTEITEVGKVDSTKTKPKNEKPQYLSEIATVPHSASPIKLNLNENKNNDNFLTNIPIHTELKEEKKIILKTSTNIKQFKKETKKSNKQNLINQFKKDINLLANSKDEKFNSKLQIKEILDAKIKEDIENELNPIILNPKEINNQFEEGLIIKENPVIYKKEENNGKINSKNLEVDDIHQNSNILENEAASLMAELYINKIKEEKFNPIPELNIPSTINVVPRIQEMQEHNKNELEKYIIDKMANIFTTVEKEKEMIPLPINNEKKTLNQRLIKEENQGIQNEIYQSNQIKDQVNQRKIDQNIQYDIEMAFDKMHIPNIREPIGVNTNYLVLNKDPSKINTITNPEKQKLEESIHEKKELIYPINNQLEKEKAKLQEEYYRSGNPIPVVLSQNFQGIPNINLANYVNPFEIIENKLRPPYKIDQAGLLESSSESLISLNSNNNYINPFGENSELSEGEIPILNTTFKKLEKSLNEGSGINSFKNNENLISENQKVRNSSKTNIIPEDIVKYSIESVETKQLKEKYNVQKREYRRIDEAEEKIEEDEKEPGEI